MLKKLDLYIIKKYLTSFFFTIILITMVSVVIDLSERIAKFISQPCTLHEIVFDYYLNFIPYINGQLWPLFALIAVIFFTSRIANDSEIIAILSSGVSYYRILVPYIVASSIIAGLFWYGKNYLIPRSTKIKNEFESTYLTHSQKQVLSSNVHFFVSPNEKVYIRYYKAKDSTAHSFRLERIEDGKLTYLLKAQKLKLKELPDKWTTDNYEERYFNGDNERYIIHKKTMLDTVFGFTPNDFVRHSKQKEMMTSGDLREFIEIERSRGLGAAKKYETELHRRSADPFTIIILTLIGFAVSSRKIRGGVGLNLALGIILGASFVVVAQFSETFSTNLSMSPALGAWMPNIIFFIIALVLIKKNSR